ncbi:activating transcription factor 7-interacting protein 1 isoform X2 [Schistocerca gregaria]|uniref:activating transcription factor 7-interacting protein 1 isoform X2 n=1 Tax=Schistocerca gregaria TaxID=7010 RepID=UPI00211F268B|nr:activating transcription factor 7-interacting protein 1 isoform X2 [Schistocerca gregaria]XP_049862280.1 activating transcription factor 7-interacting protein 1 isoform X2 [Schistocerca gregaria]XP_049862281.1 activating transcription factor 7-interacting protein 1 isoform X2 [Schistocerca gregaria]XP_049862282.1 activating transcription factor 7-interacting protein 1 isoform X2 [Schistocerca gregaria]XP_049862283.1 activating transcription factor 7-interacting protein 1 isoform X2 [Schistoc
MKLTSMFESSSETPVVKCSQDGAKSDQSGALPAPDSADSFDLSSSKPKITDVQSSPVSDLLNGDSDVKADLKKTLEPLSLNNGDGASSDDLERISCRTPVGDNDSSSEKENYVFDDGGSEASLKLRITESEDEGEMSPRATSPFEDMDHDSSEQILPQTEDGDGINSVTEDTEENYDNEEQENEATEADDASPVVKAEDSDIPGKLLRSDEECGSDTTCVQEKDCSNVHAESPGSDDCGSTELEPERSELCCDVASDSDTVKCSCDGVCSSTCSTSVSKQEIGSKLKPHTESDISLELDKFTTEHSVTHSGEQSGNLSTSGSHTSERETSSNSVTGFPDDCSTSNVLPVSEPKVSESEVATDTTQNSSVDKENISEESVTDLKTAGDVAVTNTEEDAPSSIAKTVCPVIGESAKSVKSVLAVRTRAESDSFSGVGSNGEDEDLTSQDKDCRSYVVEPVDNKRTLEVFSVKSEDINELSTADDDINYKENVSSVNNRDMKPDSDVNVSEVCVKNEREGRVDMEESETILPMTESNLGSPQNSISIMDSVSVPEQRSDDMKDSETVLPLAESESASSQNSITITNSASFSGEENNDIKESETVLPLAESELAAFQNSVTANNAVAVSEEGSDDTKVSEAVLPLAESKLAFSQNSDTVPEEGNDDTKECEMVLPLAESKSAAPQDSVAITNSVSVLDGSASSCTDVSQDNSELMSNCLEAVSKNVLEDKQADGEILSPLSESNSDKKTSDIHVNGKEVVCNGTVDNRIGDVIKRKGLRAQESCSSEYDKMADNNENVLMINQTVEPGAGESELEMKESKSSVLVDDVNVSTSETNEVVDDEVKVEGSVEEEKYVDSKSELVGVTDKVSDLENKTTDEVKGCETSRATEAEVESHVRLPETDVAGNNTQKTDSELDSNITERTSDDTIVTSGTCEDEEPLTLSDVANALKDAVDTVTLQDGESVPLTGCEASVPPLPSEVHNLPPSDMLISDNTSALGVHVADQEVQPENVQEAPGIAEAVRRRRKRSIEDVVPDRISKRTRGASLASSSGANSPEKLTQTSAESAKRPVLDSSTEEDAKRVRLNEDYNKVVKKIERTVVANGVVTGEIGNRRIFLEKIRAKDLKNLTVAELEEFFVEKICEALAYRHEVGLLRQKQQAVENQMELWRKKSLAMCKQVRDMELVMKRYQNDMKTRKDRPVIPVKVTRSVGLQVHNTVQRQSPQSPIASNVSTVPTTQSASVSTRGTTSSPQYSRTATSTNSQANVPAAGTRVPPKPNSGLKTLMPRQQSVSVNTNTSTTSPSSANSSRVQQMTRSKVASTAGNSPVGAVNKSSRQVIDLTDDGDRGRSAQPRTTAVMTSVNTNTVPANNSVGAATTMTPTSSIRLLPQPVTATAVAAGANILATGVTTNTNVPRLTYLVPATNQLQQRPVLLASSPSQVVPNAVVTVTNGQKNPAPAVYVKNGAVVSVSPLVGSGAVGQQVPTSTRPAGLQPSVAQGSPSRPQIRPAQGLTASPQSRSLPQHAQHPAPLPVAPNLNLNNPDLKKMPPRPELKISKQSRHQGIVLSWNMPVTNEYAAIASYQLYAYQESSSPPSTAHWKKVGDVKALPLPMACTLTQFVEGHKYHFAVRAVDIHSRVGPFSLPGSIVLTRK